MAIIADVAEVTVNAAPQLPQREFNDPAGPKAWDFADCHAPASRTCTKYIEAISGSEFWICVAVEQRRLFEMHGRYGGVTFDVKIDGIDVGGLNFVPGQDQRPWAGSVREARFWTSPTTMYKSGMRFGTPAVGEEMPSAADMPPFGEILVLVHRTTWDEAPAVPLEGWQYRLTPLPVFKELVTKDYFIHHTLAFTDIVSSANIYYLDVTYPDGRDTPSAVFVFKVVPQGFMSEALAERRVQPPRPPTPILAADAVPRPPSPRRLSPRAPTAAVVRVIGDPPSSALRQPVNTAPEDMPGPSLPRGWHA